MVSDLENQNPNVYKKSDARPVTEDEKDDDIVDSIDEREIFGKNLVKSKLKRVKSKWFCILDLIRNINDPEHPLTLEELHVLEQSHITVNNDNNEVKILFTPTIPHCSMATLIGLSIRVKLIRALPVRFKVTVEITPGTHSSEQAINKQLRDKERVAAALENSHLIEVINQCISLRH